MGVESGLLEPVPLARQRKKMYKYEREG